MNHIQLYYPNLTPKIDAKFAISLLHWDNVMRIFPKDGTDVFSPSQGIIKNLEEEKILINEPLKDKDIIKATELFERIMSMANSGKSKQQLSAKTLVQPLSKIKKRGYNIYRGKTYYSLNKKFPKYFKHGWDENGNPIFFCTRRTGLTYMTLLTYFLNQRKKFSNTITDQIDAFPLFIALNKILDYSFSEESIDFVPIVEASKQVEKIFFIPLLKVLKPAKFEGENTIQNIINFRSDSENEKLRKRYLERIDKFLLDLKKCKYDDEVKEVVSKHEEDFQNHLKILIAACKNYGIPVNKKIISHGRLNGWDIAGRLWNGACVVKDIVEYNVLAVVKPILKMKPSLDFYNNVLRKNEDYYPLLIQETFSPSHTQRIFAKINKFGKMKV